MDAVPIRLGQEFGGYARQIELGIERVAATLPGLRELAIGGTAVGTGLNTHAEFGARVARELSELAGTRFIEATNHFEAQGAQDAYVFAAGALTTLAASLMKIANDVRLLASGPQAGLGELILPAIQPGSSIMPGKVNPVICESVIQVGAQVTGNCQAVVIGGQWGQLDLNTMLPVMARNLLESIRLLANVARLFADKCLAGATANVERCEGYIERSISRPRHRLRGERDDARASRRGPPSASADGRRHGGGSERRRIAPQISPPRSSFGTSRTAVVILRRLPRVPTPNAVGTSDA
jgi:fumarate hydratase class II